MDAWNIYHKDGSVLCDVDGNQVIFTSLENPDVWMGECSVSITVKNDAPIIFSIGDYVIYRNERYEINYDPGKIKASSKNTYGEGFVYSDIKFNSLSDELVRAEFLDVVLFEGTVNVDGIETPLHYTALPKFSFYVEFIDDLLDRIQANMNEQYGDGVWKIFSTNMERSVVRGCSESDWHNAYGDESKYIAIDSQSITVDNSTCWDVLSLVNSKWGITFIVRGRNVYVGINGPKAPHVFKYGKGNGLREIEQTVDSEQNVITRLRAYGSDKNMPQRYYAELGKKCFANVTKVDKSVSNFIEITTDLPYNSTLFNTPRTYKTSEDSETFTLGWAVKVTFDFQTVVTAHIEPTTTQDGCCIVHTELGEPYDTGDELDSVKLQKFIESASVGKKLYFTRGIYKSAFEKEFVEFDNNMPNNMAVNRLMLPGFPDTSLSAFWNTMTEEEKKYVNPTGSSIIFSEDKYRPYLDSPEKYNAGLRQYSMYFDNDDKKNGIIEIYPTIEEMVVSGERIDEISVGSSIDDNGVFDDGQDVKDFYIKLKKQIDFDLNDVKNDDFSISLKDGMCGGRTFKINACTKESDGSWSLKCARVKDDALELWFPYKDYPIRKGDHFVLTGLELPDSYIRAASIKLLKYSISYLNSNCKTRYAFQLKVDDLFMARQHDLSVSDASGATKSLYKTLRAGDVMSIRDEDLGIDSDIVIEQLTIKEEEGNIPSYEITLRDDKSVGAITKIQDKIDSIYSAVGTGGTLNESQVESVVAKVAGKLFVTNDWFGRIFNIVDQYGNKQGENEGIAENSSIRAKMSLWSDGGISALGNSASSGGSGGGGLDAELLWSLLGNSGTEQISKSHLTEALAGYATEEWVEGKGYLTAHQDISGKADRSELSGYLPLTGGVLTGTLTANKGLVVQGRIYGSGDDEGIYVKYASNNWASIILGDTSYNYMAICQHFTTTGVKSAFKVARFIGTGVQNVFLDLPFKAGTLALTSQIPTNNNQLTNGAGYITSSDSITGNAATATNADTVDGVHVLWPGSITETAWLAAWENATTIRCLSPKSLKLSQFTDDVVSGKYLPLTGGIMTGPLRVDHYILGYNYNHAGKNAPAFVFDKPGRYMTGIGTNGETDTIYFSCATANGIEASWITSYKQKWKFNGTIYQEDNAVIHAGNIGSQSVNYAATSGVANSVAWSGVTGKPTTLSGYGITDGIYHKQVGIEQNNITWFEDYAKAHTHSIIYNTQGHEYAYLINMRNDYIYGNILKIGYADTYLRMLRRVLNKWQSNDWEKISAGFADSADKLQTARTIWGQRFDGTSNVDGNLSCNGQGSFNSLQIGNITIIYDEANKGLRIAGGGLYTDSYLSSLGVDASTALSVKKWADSINLTEESDAELATAYSIGNLYRMINSNQKTITESLNQSVSALQGRCTSLENRVLALENKVNK